MSACKLANCCFICCVLIFFNLRHFVAHALQPISKLASQHGNCSPCHCNLRSIFPACGQDSSKPWTQYPAAMIGPATEVDFWLHWSWPVHHHHRELQQGTHSNSRRRHTSLSLITFGVVGLDDAQPLHVSFCCTSSHPAQVRRPLKTVLAVHADGSKVYLSEHPQQNHRKLQLFHDINAAEAAYAESLIKERAENRCLQGGCSDHCQSNWQRFLGVHVAYWWILKCNCFCFGFLGTCGI